MMTSLQRALAAAVFGLIAWNFIFIGGLVLIASIYHLLLMQIEAVVYPPFAAFFLYVGITGMRNFSRVISSPYF